MQRSFCENQFFDVTNRDSTDELRTVMDISAELVSAT